MVRLSTAACLLLLFFTPASAGAAPVSLWHAYRGAERETLERLVRDYPGPHRIELQAVPYDAYARKLTAAIPRGNGPDLFIHAHERVGGWAASGIVRPLPEPASGSYLEITLQALRYDGRLWGWPLSYKSVVLFYNPELVASPPADTEALLAEAVRLSDPGNGRFGLVYEAGSFYHHSPWLFGFGGGVFDDRGRPRLDTPENLRSFAFLERLRRSGAMPAEITAVLVAQLFNEGRAAFVVNGPWFLGEIDQGRPFAIAPLPRAGAQGRPASPFLTVEAVMLSDCAKDQAAALEVAGWLAGDGAALTRALDARQAVANTAVYADPRIAGDRLLSVFRAQAEAATPMPNVPAMELVWEPGNQALRAVLRGDTPPDLALRQAQRRLDILGRPAPEARPVAPYAAAAGLLLLAGTGWLVMLGVRRGTFRGMWVSRRAYLWLLPAALSLGVLVLVPFLVGAAIAFFAHHQGEFTFVGVANFVSILASTDYSVTEPLSFWFTLAVTLGWTAANVLLHVSLGVALAMLLRAPWLSLKPLYRNLLIVPWAVPNYITALIWKGIFHRQFGAINGLLVWLGLEPVSWFSRFSTAFAANLATNTWLGFPFMLVVTLGALQAIPRDLEDAAEVDGAGRWQRFRSIVLPLIRPALLPAVVLGSVWTFNMFNIIYLVSGGEPEGATEILISEAYRWAFTRQNQYGYAAAYAVLIFCTLLLWDRASRRLIRTGEA